MGKNVVKETRANSFEDFIVRIIDSDDQAKGISERVRNVTI